MAQAAFEALGGHALEARAGISRARRLEELLHQTTNLLAQVTQHAAVVVGPRAELATVRSVQIVGLSARHALVVAVFSNGTIDSQTIELDADTSDLRISAASAHLQSAMVGHSIDQPTKHLVG